MAEARLTILINAIGHEPAQNALKALGAELGSLAKVAGAFTLGNLGSQLTGDLAEQFKSVLTETQKFGEEVYKLQGLIGGSAQSISGLIGGIEKLSGVEADAAGGALTRFARGLRGQVDVTETGAESGKTFAGVLSELGVSAVDATGHFRPMTDVLASVMDAEQRLASEGRAGADSMILFGRGAGLQMAPMLLLGSDAFKEAEKTAQSLGLQLTGANVESIHTFTLRQREMNEALAGLKLQLGVALMGPLTELAKGVSDVAVETNRQSGPLFRGLTTDIDLAGGALRDLKSLWDAIPDGLKGGAFNVGVGFAKGFTGITQLELLLGGLKAAGPLKDQIGRYFEQQTAAPNANLGEAWANAARQAGDLQRQSTFGQDAREGRLAALPQAGLSVSEKMLAVDQQALGAKRYLEIATHDINVAQRENLDLVKSEAAAQMDLIPLKQQQAAIALDILRTEDQRGAISRQLAVDQARLSAQPSSFALEDSQYRQQLVQAQIKAGVMGGTGIPQGAISDLIGLKRGEAGLQLAALQGGRGVTRASRAADTGNLKTGIDTAGLRMDAADLALKLASGQVQVDSLHAEIEKDRLAAAVVVADLERGRRTAEDAIFTAGQLKQELAPAINTFHYEQHITTTGEFDSEAAKQDAIAVFVTLMAKTAANTGAPAPSTVPGAAY